MANLSIPKQNLYYGRVIDSEDPQKLGRVRALISPGEINNVFRIPEDLLDETNNDIIGKYKWKREDPFVYLPLLPIHTKITPKNDELILIFFGNPDYPQQNKFYIPGPVSTLTSIGYQNFEDAKTFLSDGSNNKEDLSIIDKDPNSDVKTESFGVFPESNDNAFLGRGTADMIIKENTILLRAGKGTVQRGTLPTANNRRSFLELDYFSSQRSTDDETKKKFIEEKKVKLVKYLIEVLITNPDNGSVININGVDTPNRIYSGRISIFKLKSDKKCNSENLKQDSNIEEFKPAPVYEINFFGLSNSTLQNLVNLFVKGFNDGIINIEGYPVYSISDQFPFYYRLSYVNYLQLINSNTDPDIKENIRNFAKGINPFNLDENQNNSYALVSRKNYVGEIFDVKIEEFKETLYDNKPVTYSVMGGDELYFISHKSEIKGLGKINIDGSIYGHTQEQIGIDIRDKTNSVVRGEKLIDFLSLVVKFLTSHVHGFHNLPPATVGIDGTQSSQILKEINEAYTTILNENIRIN